MSDTQKDMNYTVGRGRVYFDLFKPGTNIGTGERYLGNTPSFSPTNEVENLDHYSSEKGIRQKDASVVLQVDQNGAFTCDDIVAENIALFFLGDVSRVTSTGATAVKDTNLGYATRGRHYQLGKTDLLPSGVRNVDNVVIGLMDDSATLSGGDISSDPAVTVLPATGNYSVDLAMGRVYIEPDSPDFVVGKMLVAQFDEQAQVRTITVGRNKMAYGALRFVADNPVGENIDYYYPKVAVMPDGEYALKGDEWQVMGFTFQALLLGGREMVYIDHRGAASNLADPLLTRVIQVTASATTATVGGAGVTITATVRNGYGDTVAGETVNFTKTGANTTLSVASGVTNVSGVATTTLTASAATSATVTASASEAGVPYSGTSPGVTFTV